MEDLNDSGQKQLASALALIHKELVVMNHNIQSLTKAIAVAIKRPIDPVPPEDRS